MFMVGQIVRQNVSKRFVENEKSSHLKAKDCQPKNDIVLTKHAQYLVVGQ